VNRKEKKKSKGKRREAYKNKVFVNFCLVLSKLL